MFHRGPFGCITIRGFISTTALRSGVQELNQKSHHTPGEGVPWGPHVEMAEVWNLLHLFCRFAVLRISHFAKPRGMERVSGIRNLLASDDVQTFKILHGIATNALRDMVVAALLENFSMSLCQLVVCPIVSWRDSVCT